MALVGAVASTLVATAGAATSGAATSSAPDVGAVSAGWSADALRLLRRHVPQPVVIGGPGLANHPVKITDSGVVVGYSSELRVPDHAWRWQDGTMSTLYGFGGDTWPVDVNDSGQTVGWSSSPEGRGVVLWEPDGTTVVLAEPETDAWASAIDERGRVAGTVTRDGVQRAVLWHDGVTTDLGALGDGPVSTSLRDALNERGEVVGTSWVSGRPHAFLWRDGVMTALPTPAGATSTALGVDDRGRVLGRVDDPAGPDGPVVWADGRVHLLDPDGRAGFDPRVVHEDGLVAGRGGPSGDVPMVWERRTGLRVLPGVDGTVGDALGLGRPGLVGGFTRPGTEYTRRAAVWVLGVPVPLGERVAGSSRPTDSVVSDVNDQGQAVGYLWLQEPVTGDPYAVAVIWELVPGR